MKVLEIKVKATHDEMWELQEHMAREGHELGAMQLRLLMNRPERDVFEFMAIEPGSAVAKAVVHALTAAGDAHRKEHG